MATVVRIPNAEIMNAFNVPAPYQRNKICCMPLSNAGIERITVQLNGDSYRLTPYGMDGKPCRFHKLSAESNGKTEDLRFVMKAQAYDLPRYFIKTKDLVLIAVIP